MKNSLYSTPSEDRVPYLKFSNLLTSLSEGGGVHAVCAHEHAAVNPPEATRPPAPRPRARGQRGRVTCVWV